jgi:DNA polymerase III delta subunit
MSAPAPLLPAYAIWGEDRAKVERAVAQLIARVAREGGLPPERFPAAETGAETVVAACEALSLAGVRLVLVEGAEDWRAADAAPVVAYLEAPNPGTCLALVARAAPGNALLQAVEGAGKVLHYGPDPAGKGRARTSWFVKHFSDEVARLGGRVSPSVARRAVERVMVDRPDARRLGITALELTSAAGALVAYAGDEPIDAEMVAALVPRHPEARLYELADAIAAGEARRAHALLADLATGDDPAAPIVIEAGLARHFRTLAVAQELGPDVTPAALEEATGVRGYPATKAVEQARALPPGAARAAVVRIAALELDLRVSSFAQLGRTPDDGARLVLELALRDLLALARGAPAAAEVGGSR